METKLDGYALISTNSGNKISKREINYQQLIQFGPPYLGSPITQSVARVLINNYRSDPSQIVNTIVIGVDFGCNDLKTILGQANCKAIRFYLAKKYKVNFEDPTNIKEGITLVAIGIDENGSDIATNENVARNIDGSQNIDEISVDNDPITQNGIIFEMVPPVIGGKRIAKAFVSQTSFEKAMKKYFKFI